MPVDFKNNLFNLINVCAVNSDFYNKIRVFNDGYFEVSKKFDEDLEERLHHKISDMTTTETIKHFLELLFVHILEKRKDVNFLDVLNENDYDKINKIILLLYNHLIGKISSMDMKIILYLELFNINAECFPEMSYDTMLDLCELKFKNINIYDYEDYGSIRIKIIKDVVNGNFKDRNTVNLQLYIASIFDKIFEEKNDYTLNLNGKTFIIEMDDAETLLVFSLSDVSNPLCIVDKRDGFLVGSFDSLLNNVTIAPDEVKKDYLQELISSFRAETA